MSGRDSIGNDRSTCRLLKRLNNGHSESGHVNMPRFNPAGENQHSQSRKHQTIGHLSDHDLHLARVTVGCAPRHRRQKQRWNRLNSPDQAELQG
jgi:hypothetical protein